MVQAGPPSMQDPCHESQAQRTSPSDAVGTMWAKAKVMKP